MNTFARLFWKKNQIIVLKSRVSNAERGQIFSEVNKMSNSNGESGNKSEFRLKNAPEDGISSVRFGPNSSQFLLVSSWDKNVRLYDVTNNNLRVKYSHQRPVLSCAFQDPIHVWSGCLDGKLKSFDINSNQESVIGMHENTIRCIEFSNEINAVSDF